MNRLSILISGIILLSSFSIKAEDYNRIGLSYGLEQLHSWMHDEFNTEQYDYLNGFGLDYYHGFRLKTKRLRYIEVGANMNFYFYTQSKVLKVSGIDVKSKYQFQNMNLTIPANYVWRYDISDEWYVALYAGINIRLNYVTRDRSTASAEGYSVSSDWRYLLRKSASVRRQDVWNVFQAGAQVGVRLTWQHASVGLQYGYDFVPAYYHSYKLDDKKWSDSVSTMSLRAMVGYEF